MSEKRELVVLGGGPGGYAAAFKAADLGLKVTLIDEEENPGGVCLYRGCIPSKALLHAAKVIREAEKAADFGLRFGKLEIDIDKLRKWKEDVVLKLTRGLGMLCKRRKIETIRGTARFKSGSALHVELHDGGIEEVEFEHAIIATGAVPATIPSVSMDSEHAWDSTDSLNLPEIPESLLVIGGGYIGLEQANIYAPLGTKITVCEMMDQLMPGTDKDLAAIMLKHMKKQFEEILLNTKVVGAEEKGEGMKVRFEDRDGKKSEKTYSKVLVAVGRKPNSKDLGLENTGVKPDSKGFIRVDKQRRTDDPHLFAIGDITGDPQFAHKAMHEGLTAAMALTGKPAAFDPRAIPYVEYTDLEAAGCGLSETQAKEQNIEIKIGKFPWSASGRAATMAENEGLTKLIFDAATNRLLGVGIIGSDAGKLISEGALALEMGAVAEDIAYTIHPHPTLSETIMEAAHAVIDRSIHI